MAKRAAQRTDRRAAQVALLTVAIICLTSTPSAFFAPNSPGSDSAKTVTSADKKPAMKEKTPKFSAGPGFLKIAVVPDDVIGARKIAEKHGVQHRSSGKGQYFPWSTGANRRKTLAFSGPKEAILSAFKEFREQTNVDMGDGERTWLFLFPRSLLSETLRDKGEKIKRFKKETQGVIQANIEFPPGPEAMLIVRTKGDGADEAAQWLVSLLPDDDADRQEAVQSISDTRYAPAEVVERASEIYMGLSPDKVGLFLGTKGSNVERLSNQFSVDLKLDTKNALGDGQKILKITGCLGDVQACYTHLLLKYSPDEQTSQ